MKRLLTFLISLGMVLMCLPIGVSAVNLSVVTFVAEGGKVYTSNFGEMESPYTYMVSEGKSIEMEVWAESDDPQLMFSGWALSEGGEPVYQNYDIANYVPTGDITFYAVFEEYYTMILNANGGYFWGDAEQTKAEYQIPKGSAVEGHYSTPEYPDNTKAQVGWAYTPDGEAELERYLYDFVPTGDVELYAVWEDAYQIILDANGGYFWGNTEIKQITVAVPKGENLNNYYSEPENPGKALAGWSTAAGGAVEYLWYLSDCYPESDMTLYAVWEDAVQVTLDANGGYFYNDHSTSKVSYTVKNGGCVGDRAPEPVYPGNAKALAGWSTTADGKAEYNRYLTDCYPESDITLYAVWEDAYVLTLNGNGYGYFYTGNGREEIWNLAIPKSETVGRNYIPNTDSEYAFSGWSYTADGPVAIDKYNLSSLKLDGPLTLYAVWEEALTITLDANGKGYFDNYNHSTTYIMRVAKGQRINSMPYVYPADDHYALGGWSFTSDGSVDIASNEIYGFIPKESMTLYAVWVEGITLTLDGNGNGRFHTAEGLSSQMKVTVPKGGRIDTHYMPEAIDDSLGFAGWSYKPDGDVEIEKYGLMQLSLTEDTTLYAVWKECYTVTLHANGGYFMGDQTDAVTLRVAKGQAVQDDYAPTNDNMNLYFDGWSYTANGKVDVDELWEFVPEKDTDLYAVWVPTHTVTFKTKEGWFLDYSTYPVAKVQEIKYSAGKYGVFPPESGHDDAHRTIAGWSYKENGTVDFNNKQIYGLKPESDMTLYAVWGHGWTVTLDANGGYFHNMQTGRSLIQEITVPDNELLANTRYFIPTTSDGKEFSGYSLTKDGPPVDEETFRITSDITLYAVWDYEFEISEVWRVAGSGRFQTSYQIAEALREEKGVEQFEAVILTSGLNFADALAGSYLSYKKKAPILITADDFGGSPVYEEINFFIQNNLKPGGTIYVLGGTGAVSEKALTGLDGFEIKRLRGASRFETNIEILKAAGVKDEEILVATAFNFADSLSASAVNKPILLVDQELREDQKAYLDTLETEQFYILGGTAAVTDTVEQQLKEYGEVDRIKGKGRHETSIAIAEQFCSNAEDAVLAFSGNFPDGLCAGPLASALGAPLILTTTGQEAAAQAFCNPRNITKGYVIGGEKQISDPSARRIFSLRSQAIILRW